MRGVCNEFKQNKSKTKLMFGKKKLFKGNSAEQISVSFAFAGAYLCHYD